MPLTARARARRRREAQAHRPKGRLLAQAGIGGVQLYRPAHRPREAARTGIRQLPHAADDGEDLRRGGDVARHYIRVCPP